MQPFASRPPQPIPESWAWTDEQRDLYAASQRFARDRLVPLLSAPASDEVWQETIRLAATLELGTMILPAHLGGMAIDRHDLALVVSALAAGPLERAAELTISVPALMTMRAHDALGWLAVHDIQDYFDGKSSIAWTVPDSASATLWRLRSKAVTRGQTLWSSIDGQKLALIEQLNDPKLSQGKCVATLGTLCLERVGVDELGATAPCMTLMTLEQRDPHGVCPVQTWLTEIGLYLCALSIGAMQHSVQFALDYGTSRQAFKKPLMAHQLVATRLADMLIATHGSHLFLRSVASARAPLPVSLVRQLVRHIVATSADVNRKLVQFCGGHGYVEGLPPAARFQTNHWFAWLLMRIDSALAPFTTSAQS
ncbi:MULTISPECIES: acyl-CoA dehydrogenase family protein [Burkholderia]|uniref:Alkylation response protein AidB-like acyl-CoA dehydrogenase n=1 Tax=Burkholderia pyrrocinia TaxID=60550 RepID=A0A318I1Y1_BURPY|nr:MULTISPECIES: acyl-CoA dehydrogenase family protein [Burkholderia]PXX23110.1 alkylation response protein AidB-like acyl-CoA dehydrogenase [Burkholderia pyrrocinia]SFW88823.1 Acyl-CoA dehydrogenase [Burkholderia sp. NFACC33-1]SFY46190.1 Acyl-CoA dehydrogenase [Burkholderia sp. NFPP32]